MKKLFFIICVFAFAVGKSQTGMATASLQTVQTNTLAKILTAVQSNTTISSISSATVTQKAGTVFTTTPSSGSTTTVTPASSSVFTVTQSSGSTTTVTPASGTFTNFPDYTKDTTYNMINRVQTQLIALNTTATNNKLVSDSIDNQTKLRLVTYTFAIPSTTITYSAGQVITTQTATAANAFSLSLPTGNWEIVEAYVYLGSYSNSSTNIRLFFSTNTFTLQGNGSTFSPASADVLNFIGGLAFTVSTSVTSIYHTSARAQTGTTFGDLPIKLIPSGGAIYFAAVANAAMNVVPASQVFTFKFILRRWN